MSDATAFIGFGEAGMAFASPGARAYDRKTDHAATAPAKRADYAAAKVIGAASAAEALAGADAILSLVTADQALAAALACAPHITPGALWFDMNSVAPGTKRDAAEAIKAAGGRYVDVAVMAPVHPKRLATPLLLGGPHADTGAAILEAIGFTAVTTINGPVGKASSIKMIRSVMVKGMEALAAECALAADRAGVVDEVLGSLGASFPGIDWPDRVDYCLDRMLVHGTRRAAEMHEVSRTLESLGVAPMMSEATIGWQQRMGSFAIDPPHGLAGKLAAIKARQKEIDA